MNNDENDVAHDDAMETIPNQLFSILNSALNLPKLIFLTLIFVMW